MADIELIKPRELPEQANVQATDALMVDNGTIVGKATPEKIVNAGAPVASEAEALAGVNNTKRMTPLRVRQVLDNVNNPAVLRAQAWAESSTPPDPLLPDSKSAKTWASIAEQGTVMVQWSMISEEGQTVLGNDITTGEPIRAFGGVAQISVNGFGPITPEEYSVDSDGVVTLTAPLAEGDVVSGFTQPRLSNSEAQAVVQGVLQQTGNDVRAAQEAAGRAEANAALVKPQFDSFAQLQADTTMTDATSPVGSTVSTPQGHYTRVASGGDFVTAGLLPYVVESVDGIYSVNALAITNLADIPIRFKSGNVALSVADYVVSDDLNLGNCRLIVPMGARIVVSAGKTLTLGNIPCAGGYSIFYGDGTVKIRQNNNNIAWYAGSDLTEKLNRMFRGIASGERYTVKLDPPMPTDPAYTTTNTGLFYKEGTACWRISSTFEMNDKHNCGNWFFNAPIIVDSGIVGFELSTIDKTEDIQFWDVDLLGQWVGSIGVLMHGGARIHFRGKSRCRAFVNGGMIIRTDRFPADEPLIEWLDVTGCGVFGLVIEGGEGNPSGNGPIIGGQLNYLFSNGGLASQGAVAHFSGVIREFDVGKIITVYSNEANLIEPSEATTLITNNQWGAPSGLRIGQTRIQNGPNSVPVKVRKNGDNTARISCTIDAIHSSAFTGATIQLGQTDNVVILPQPTQYTNTKSVLLDTTCSNTRFQGVEPDRVDGRGDKMIFDGVHILPVTTLADDSALSFNTSPANRSMLIDVICQNDDNAIFSGTVRLVGRIITTYAGSAINIMQGTVLSGNTGPDGKVTISCRADGTIFIENRLGVSREFVATVRTL